MARHDSMASQGLALEARSLDALKLKARQDPQASARHAARQFEAQFAQMLLGQMRQTSLAGQGGLASALNTPAAQTWRGMLDQQLAQSMAGLPVPGRAVPDRSGLGLADVIEQQLNRSTVSAESVRQAGVPRDMSTLDWVRGQAARSAASTGDAGAAGASAPAGAVVPQGMDVAAAAMARALAARRRAEASPEAAATRAASQAAPVAGTPEEIRASFMARFLPAARRAEAETGIPAAYILGQAALESGWGRAEIRSRDGQRSHNLFGIKATGWSGRVAHTRTTEYENGKPVRVGAGFRAYDSYDEAFLDYARMLSNNPRYADVVKSARSAEQFAQGLQRAGYATDPRYAEKLVGTIRRVMKIVV